MRHIFLLCILAISLPACADHTYKGFNFKTAHIGNVNQHKIVLFVRGTYKKVSQSPKITHQAAPYTLSVFGTAQEKINLPIKIKNIKVYQDKKIILSFKDNDFKIKQQRVAKTSTKPPLWQAIWSAKDLELPHKDTTLTATLIFEKDGKRTEQKIDMTLKASYSERKSNDFWDGIMSV